MRKHLREAAGRLRVIGDRDGRPLGRAAVAIASMSEGTLFAQEEYSAGHLTIGGLSADEPRKVSPRAHEEFVGTIEVRPGQASRMQHDLDRYGKRRERLGNVRASKAVMKRWIEDQRDILLSRSLSKLEMSYASCNMYRFGLVVPEFIHFYDIREGVSVKSIQDLQLITMSEFLNENIRRFAMPIRFSQLASGRYFDQGKQR
jgi:hypothetical protein